MLDKIHISKDEINLLPTGQYDGDVVFVDRTSQIQPTLNDLFAEPVLGFDTETKPAYKKGEKYDPAVLQLATADRVFVYQLSKTGLTEGLAAVLADASIVKTGVAIMRDFEELQALRSFKPKGMVELAQRARALGLKNEGLRGLTALLLGFRISKSAQRSNWGAGTLTDKQIQYAATDAWVGRKLYLKFEQLASEMQKAKS